MHKQARKYWCGPASVQNALEALGIKASQKKIAELCGTSKEGTTEYMLNEGLDALGLKTIVVSFNESFLARQAIQTQLRHGNPVLLCVDNWQHWVTLVAPPLRDRFPIVDPLAGDIKLQHWKYLERRWRAAGRAQTGPFDKTYYAVGIQSE